MGITSEAETKILRYYYVEKWRVGTIARELHVHHTTVKRVLAQSGVPKEALVKPGTMIDPFMGFIMEQLKAYPNLRASRLYHMVRERGYPGGMDHFRHLMAMHRPRRIPEAYLRLRTLPGEEAQVDWAHFSYMHIGKAKRPIMAFVMVLSYSRNVFLHFYLHQRLANFLHGHELAFAAFEGVPRVLLYDNLRSAVLERQADAIRFNPELLKFAAHYRFEPRPVAVRRGNEKGRVERAIRYVRDSFFPARQWTDIADLNRQAAQWCAGVAADRPCPEDRTQSVKAVFIAEQPKLLSLPDNPYPTEEQVEVSVGKTPYVRFDWNDYSVPHKQVRSTLSVRATTDRVRILNGQEIIAEHARSYDKGQQIEDEAHIKKLTDWKKKAKQHRGQDRLTHAAPSAPTLLGQAADKNYHLASTIKQLLSLLDDYGAVELEIAIQEALGKNVPHPNAVRMSLEKRREEQNKLPPVRLDLPDDQRIRNQIVRPHNLTTYDQVQYHKENKDD